MNAQEKAIYRDQLRQLMEHVKSIVPTPAHNEQAAFSRSGFDLPSAAHRNMAGVLEDSIITAEKGLSDEQMQGVSMAMHLAYLVASESGAVAGMVWNPDYQKTLETLGWRTKIKTAILNTDVGSSSKYEDVAARASEIIGCHSIAPLAKESVAKLDQNQEALELLKNSGRISGSQFGFTLTPMPSLSRQNEIRFGAVYSRVFYIDGQPTLGSSPSGIFRVGSALLFTLEPAKFELMREAVEPALIEFSRRKFEEIRL